MTTPVIQTMAAQRPPLPYPGLRPFETGEWSIFFGRERMTDDVIARLADTRLVVIHGSSGSGKSSLVRAGVMPKLARQHQRHGTPWITCAMRPAGGPLWNLASEFARLEGRAGDIARTGAITSLFSRKDATLASVAASLEGLAGKSLCILADQFEELFRFEKETSREEAELFAELLERPAAEDAPVSVHVVVTMRSEFLGECARFAGLADIINRTQYLVPRLDDEALMRAVRRPAQMFGGHVPEALAERLVAQVRGREDELPLLQHGLMLMWDARGPGEGGTVVLDGKKVEDAGGLAALLSAHADDVMASVATSEASAKQVELLFRELTDVNAEGAAIRRPQTLAALAAAGGTTTNLLEPIVDAFRAPGVSFLAPYAPAPVSEQTIIDISHEALIRCWDKISVGPESWLKQEFDDGLAWRSLLSEAEAFGKDKRRLLSAAATEDRGRLYAARNEAWSRRYGGGWAAVGGLLEASRKAAAQAKWNARFAMGALAGLTLGALGLAAVATIERGQAESAKRQAEVARNQAEEATVKVAQQSELSTTLFAQITNIGDTQSSDKNPAEDMFDKTKFAAETGNSVAVNALGFLYYKGNGTPQDYKKAFEWFLKAAKAGNRIAMREVGILYANGQGVATDLGAARSWYMRAAAGGDTSAMVDMGLLHAEGHGVPRDFAVARDWYEKAAAAGNVNAPRYLAALYAGGDGVPRDFAKALELFKKAAKAGDAEAMRLTGSLYEKGQGVAQDYAKALQYYDNAAAAGNAEAMRDAGRLHAAGLGTSVDYTAARQFYEKAAGAGSAAAMDALAQLYASGRGVSQNYAKARDWYEKASASGITNAMNQLGDLNAKGLGGVLDYAKAREWYEKAIAAGDVNGMWRLGILYYHGRGVGQNSDTARLWFEKAAANGNAEAMSWLGDIYQQGTGVPKDLAKALELYQKSAAGGAPSGMNSLGILNEDGDGVPQNYTKALEWYEKAAALEDAAGMYNAGNMYYDGTGVKADFEKARNFFERAANLGDADAMKNLGYIYENGESVYEDLPRSLEWFQRAAAAGDSGSLTEVSRIALSVRDFKLALDAADRSVKQNKDTLGALIKRANALMYLGRTKEAREIYLLHKDEEVPEEQKSWKQVVLQDFKDLVGDGLERPLMKEIKAAFAKNK